MGCSTCSNNKSGGTPAGCKSNGNCGVSGCGKLDVFDWLSDVQLPSGQQPFDIVEVRFKNTRKAFYRNLKNIALSIGDVITVDTSPGFDVGVVAVTGELVRLQMNKKGVKQDNYELKRILRKSTQEDIDSWQEARVKEEEAKLASRKLAAELNLVMKISDVEYQGDKSKATFYYTADDRVDFRELIKRMAEQFKVRIEMRQIGSRQEAGRLGGIGSCGRELCCSTWLSDFRSVSTNAARYQQLSLNPQKLAGQCGKLKCCLNYELDMYMEALKSFPDTHTKLQTKKGPASHFKTDIFKRTVWYLYDSGVTGPIPLSVDRALDVVKMNAEGQIPADLKDFQIIIETPKENLGFENVVGQDSLTRFDKPKKAKAKRPVNKNKPRPNRPQVDGVKPAVNTKAETSVEGNRKPRPTKARNPRNNNRNRNRPQGDTKENKDGNA